MRWTTVCVSVIAGLVIVPLTALSAHADPLVSGHRGTLVGAPESTMPAFAYAAKNGANAIEFDVRWTSDDHKYVMHDATLDRTTDCTGPLEKVTHVELAACDAGSWFSPDYTGTRVPSFRAVLAYAKTKGLQVNPEVKPVRRRPLTTAQAKSYVSVVYAAGMGKKTVVSSTSTTILAKIKKADTKKLLRYSLISTTGVKVLPAKTVAESGKVYMPTWRQLTKAKVTAYHKAGIKLWVWPLATDADYAGALKLSPDVIVVDDPAQAKAYLKAH